MFLSSWSFKYTALAGLLVVASVRAEIKTTAITNGYGLITLSQPVSRSALNELVEKSADPEKAVLWLRLPDGRKAAIDDGVNRLLPDSMLKVFTMSSKSPRLEPGTVQGEITIFADTSPGFSPDDWALQPGEITQKRVLVEKTYKRFQSVSAEDLTRIKTYYDAPNHTMDEPKSTLEKKLIGESTSRPPKLRSTRVSNSQKLEFTVMTVQPGEKVKRLKLTTPSSDLVSQTTPVQVPLGNYNYDADTVLVLGNPNEMTVAEGVGLDLFTLTERRWGKGAVAGIELKSYSGFTVNITAEEQGLLLVPPDDQIDEALSEKCMLFVCTDKMPLVILRTLGQSPAESSGGIESIIVILK